MEKHTTYQPEYRTNQFDDIDFNNDDKVDLDEYCDAQTYLYDILDRNEDNRLSKNEISDAVKNKRFYEKDRWADPVKTIHGFSRYWYKSSILSRLLCCRFCWVVNSSSLR